MESNKQAMKTPLNQNCLEAGSRRVSFAGWEMPIQFSGLIKEHEAVPKKAGLFDLLFAIVTFNVPIPIALW